jgi:hypothetical protein
MSPMPCVTDLTLALALAVAGAEPDETVFLQAVDARTGAGVAARALVSGGGRDPLMVEVPPEGERAALPAVPAEVRMEASGYRPLSAVVVSTDLPVTFEMDPVGPAVDAGALTESGTSILHGYVLDAVTARPVADATVVLPQRDRVATTDAAGYFRFTLPAPTGHDGREALATLRITAAGYGPHEVTGLVIADGATLLRERLAPGQQPTSRDDMPKALLVPSGDDPTPALPRTGLPLVRPGEGNGLVPLDPPASIRVGTSCTCATCGGVSVLSLETYVKRGLNDEWIASWNGHSLRAGAVGYRAYGAWYALHPISPAYDICNTTCCQVNDTDTSTATDAAVDRTAGFLLERGAAVFRAEYSAENNAWDDPDDGLSCSNADLSCADGSAGSPATGWSCLTDGVDAGHGCFGHGRGACQWGTQRWSLQGRRWPWILDHYYNGHGTGTGLRTARISTPLVLLTAQAPRRVPRDATFILTARASNRASVAHAHVLLGASLRSGARVLSDPAHDALVTLPPGDSDVTRAFEVPFAARNGTYDLLLGLYDDVDEDGRITGGTDLPLQLMVMPGAVELCSPQCPPIPPR